MKIEAFFRVGPIFKIHSLTLTIDTSQRYWQLRARDQIAMRLGLEVGRVHELIAWTERPWDWRAVTQH